MTSPEDSPVDPTVGARLDDDGHTVVSLLSYRMMTADVVAERSDKARRPKMAARDEQSAALAETLTAPPQGASSWRVELARTLEGTSDYAQRSALSAAAARVTARVSSRLMGLAVLVELSTFSPWPEGSTWVSRIRMRSLEQVAGEIDGLSSDDVGTVDAELSAQLRAMARAQVSWGKVAAVGAVGVGLGAVTMGAAAAPIGAMIGGAAGLSGAAATSAGLAMLGGGSLAAGGFGVSGGTAVLVGAGTLLGAGVGAGGARVAQVASGGLVREVVRTEVHTRVVVIEETADDEAARRVVVAMERRLDEVTGKLGELAGRLRALSQEKKQLQAELGAEKDKVTALLAEKEDLRLALEAEQQQTALAQVALTTSIKRLGDTGSAVGGDDE